MTKDAKGHGSGKRTFEVSQGEKSYRALHSSMSKAKEAAGHNMGIKQPTTARLVESKATQKTNQSKALEAGKHLLGRKIDLSGIKSTNGKPSR